MKGTIFSNPLEYSIETEGEAWPQGSLLKGILKIINHADTDVELKSTGCILAQADIKKVHTKDPKAFNQIIRHVIPDQKIQARATLEFPFEFKLNANILITDKKESLYLTYGPSALEGNLQLNIKPQTIFIKTTEMLSTFYSFKVKGTKNTKKGLEFKFDAPESKDYTLVDQMYLTLKTDEVQSLYLDFCFEVKRMDMAAISAKFKAEEKTYSKILTTKEYLFGKDLINQDKMLKTIEEVIVQVKGKGLY